ncbi:MAG: hypothetical protein LBG95_09185 [Treponema sp.]|jgi:hypothetical protein|nr:hypothetical protein [Treponema sp.]
MKQIKICLLLLPSLFTACVSTPAVAAVPAGEEQAHAVSEPKDADFHAISQEMYDHTLAEVRLFVDGLNTMIRDKNYAKWKDTLSDEFYARISSPDFLATASDSVVLRSKNITLKIPQDYFINVVVPSRAQSRVDEIEFTAENRIKVYYLEGARRNPNATDTGPRRLRLYDLVKDGDTWKIID